MFHQTRTFSHKKFNDLKAKSLQGDASATIELHNLCMKRNAGISLSDVMPVLVHHLSSESLASARTFTDARMDSLPVLNAIPSLKILQYFLDEDLHPSQNFLPFLSSILPTLTEWFYLLLEGMGILSADFTSLSAHSEDLIECISLLIHAFAQYPSLYCRIRDAPGFVPFFMNCWICVSAAGCYISQVALATILLSMFGKEVDQPSFGSSEDSVVLHAVQKRPVEVAKASVQGVVSLVNEPAPQDFEGVIAMVLEAMAIPRICSPICVRALLAHNALTWLCRLAHRVLNFDRESCPRILSRVMREIDALLLQAHANSVALILQANILEIVIRVEPISRHPNVYARAGVSADELEKSLLSIIATLTGFVMYRSLLSLFRKSVRLIERQSLADGSSPVLEAYRELDKLVRTRREWMKSHDVSSTRCPCVNRNVSDFIRSPLNSFINI
ncbi:hypothetical protein BDZ89DRAFT_367682 [Hymenopellis radicata]|nr:hypothetical protein BDZ89DRAFT_367682 [Hymenopellis radicata]